ncbi:MAG: hypothetical protein KA436_04095 [Oligoflexales bacterium]|nr:hypothetical protein [Oligoflexales bacterium]
MAENDPTYKALRIELSQLAERLAPHHFKALSRGVSLWDRARAPEMREIRLSPPRREEKTPVPEPLERSLIRERVVEVPEIFQEQADFNPFDEKFESKWDEREKKDDYAFIVPDERPLFAKIFWFMVAHLFDLFVITACAVLTLLSFKVALLGYQETVRDGLTPFVKYWFETFSLPEVLMGLYAIFLCYATLFYVIVGSTLGGLLARTR